MAAGGAARAGRVRVATALAAMPAVLTGLSARAQPAPGATLAPTPGASITVIGRPLPDGPATPAYDVQVLERSALANSAADRIEDVLGNVAGFQSFRRSDSRSANPSAQGVTLRALGGNAASRTLVLLDGVPIADPLFGSVPLSALSPDLLDRVRVTRGGGSGAFGAGAVAGTIELESAGVPTLAPVSSEAAIDDRGETSLSATLAPRVGEGFVVAGARWDRGAGFFTTPVDQRVPATVRAHYDSWSLSLRGVAPVAPGAELQVHALLFDDHRTLRFAGADSSSSGADASLRLIARGRWQVDGLAYVQARGFSNVVVSASSFRPVLVQRRTPSTGLGGKIELRPPVGANQLLRVGADLRLASGTMVEDTISALSGAITGERRTGGRNGDAGFFAQDDWKRGPLEMTAGLRADRTTISDGQVLLTTPAGLATSDSRYSARGEWNLSARGGAVWQVIPTVALRASAYTGLRQPTLNRIIPHFRRRPGDHSGQPGVD